MKTDERSDVFALLDDCDASAARRSSRLYTGFVREHVATDAAGLDAVCAAAAADAASGLHAVVLGDYEFGRDLHLGDPPKGGDSTQRETASLRFLLFERCASLSRDDTDAWLISMDGNASEPSAAGAANVVESVTREEYDAAIAAVHAALVAGDSYEINYTYRLAFDVFGSPIAFYRRLRARQPVHYGALIALPAGEWVLSCSPELFVEKKGARLRTRPMKGTTARGRTPEDDARARAFLHNDVKNRAENLMIVDLLRNDLSRVARTGSVRVPALFSVEPYPSIWAMTSTIEAELAAGVSFADVLRALFPCGSITGAPKHRTMQLIDEIETTPRGLYTGTIGWYDAPGPGSGATTSEGVRMSEPCGEFCLSVAIRTLTLAAPDAAPARHDGDLRRGHPPGLLRGSMGIGGGIVLDSVAADEYAECRLKARFLTGADPGFQLFETMRATRTAGVAHLDRHLARLAGSAAQLDFAFDEGSVRRQIAERCEQLAEPGEHRFRLAIGKDGTVAIATAPLGPVKMDEASFVGVLLAPEHGFTPRRSNDFLLRHKTTHRAEFDRGWREAEARGGFDTLFFNERGELTEGGRSNVFVKLEGRWWTPPLEGGLLPGIMRQLLLEDPQLGAHERVLTLADVRNAEALLVCNALRGALAARILPAGAAVSGTA
ncbi:para-aminobenzoate synthetase/4-amino-4-deoxychorismate lyase [Trinickia symbiotica]|uniref:Chloride transporter n=1 Tax=Trinickia symbiotica TaxID=863227 RepID=A0A2N7WYZ8_9BURK|nr:bifunctional anthranilate synthase component I family protein/class IV aminotransferase [Trinickia symbiotica]PMS34455.1 chloride transporter [Trinickia symbiotica]PPK43216.1 para-aminobenzoate synthetase/4-amino-4-deoxychorismate lyase [Trinickia symbiotica]